MKSSVVHTLLAMAAINAHADPFTRADFNGNHSCKNCHKPTFKSDVCDLRCLSQWKAKQKSEAI